MEVDIGDVTAYWIDISQFLESGGNSSKNTSIVVSGKEVGNLINATILVRID